MLINTKKPRLDDELPMLLADAYDNYASKDSNPCSICRDTTQLGGKRMHFHGTDIGSCYRQTYFKMTRTKESYQKPSWNHPMFLKDGHVHEETILKAFESNPAFTIRFGDDYKGEVMELQQKIPFFNRLEGVDVLDKMTQFVLQPVKNRVVEKRHFILVTHFDALGLYRDGDEEIEFIIECKAVKDETWKKVMGGEIEDKWYGQIQSYMFTTGIHRAYLIVKNRTSSRILSPIRIDYDRNYMIKRLVKLTQVYTFVNYGREVPHPKGWTPKNPECKYCDFNDFCWKKDSNDLKGDE